MGVILHIDFDSYFASVEQEYNPKLRRKPVGVIAHHSRSCIIAASREAKKFGIKTGSRSFEAKKLCPDIILVPADFVKYFEISKRFLNICKEYSPFVELFSIDEVFMDITKTEHLFGGAYQIIKKIKDRIRVEIGEYITASIGISHNKLLAKMASSINKPDGVFEINSANIDEVYKNSKLTDVCGIGERIKIRLNRMGVCDLIQLKDISYSLLVSEFGVVEAEFLKNVSFGYDPADVVPYTISQPVKSIGRNYCLPRNEYNQKIVLQNFYELCEEVGVKLRSINKRAGTVGFSLRGSVNIHGRRTFDTFFDTGKEIFDRCMSQIVISGKAGIHGTWILNQVENDKRNYIRQISIWVSNLAEKQNLQLSLFDKTEKNERLIKAVDKINGRFGNHTIRSGFLLYADKLTTVPNGFSKRI